MAILTMEAAIQYREGKIRNGCFAVGAMLAIALGMAVLFKILLVHTSMPFSIQSLVNSLVFILSLLSNTVGLDWKLFNQIFPGHYLQAACCAGAALLSLIVYCFIREIVLLWKVGLQARPTNTMALWGLTHGIAMTLIIAIGRSSRGLDATQWPRYYTCLIPLLFGLYLGVYGWERNRIRTVFLSGLLMLLLTANIPWPASRGTPGTELAIMKRDWKDCYLKYEDFSYCNQQVDFRFGLSGYPTQEQLNFLKKNHLNLFAD